MFSARRTFSAVAILAAILGLAASIHAYLTPATGVDDTAGPILTAIGHAALALGAVLLLLVGTARGLLFALFILAGLATCVAAFLLQQPLILFPAAVALVMLPLGHMFGGAR